MVTFHPMEDKVIIEKIKKDNKSSGGIILPDLGKESAMSGRVIAIGTGRTLENGHVVPMKSKVGSIVVYPQYAAQILKYENKELVVIAEKDLFAIIEEEKSINKNSVKEVLSEIASEVNVDLGQEIEQKQYAKSILENEFINK